MSKREESVLFCALSRLRDVADANREELTRLTKEYDELNNNISDLARINDTLTRENAQYSETVLQLKEQASYPRYLFEANKVLFRSTRSSPRRN